MASSTVNTLTGYLGHDFQQNLMWQILVEQEFGNRVANELSAEYFDDPNLKRLIIIVKEYFKEYGKVPNLQSQTVEIAINKYKSPNNIIEHESLFAIVDRLKQINEKVINGIIPYNGDVIQKETVTFIKQQEYRKFGEFVLEKTKTGEIKDKHIIVTFEEKLNKIGNIGDEESVGIKPHAKDNILFALRREFRETIRTGIAVLDGVTGGGLGKGEVAIILTPSGVGKTTTLSKVANTAFNEGKKVLQIIFEDTESQVSRKHYAIWSGIPLSEMDDRCDEVADKVFKRIEYLYPKGGELIIQKFSQENTTMTDIKNWIIKYQKKHGFKFDIVVLDYLDCLESTKKSEDRQESELSIMKSFLAMAADFDIPCWSAIQSNRGGFSSAFLEVEQMGGNVKRIQKSHLFLSIAKPPEHKDSSLVNISILKARFIKDGQKFENSILNNDTMEIVFNDKAYENKYEKLSMKSIADAEMIKFTKVNQPYAAIGTFGNEESETIADVIKIHQVPKVKIDEGTIEERIVSSAIPIIDEPVEVKISPITIEINKIYNNSNNSTDSDELDKLMGIS